MIENDPISESDDPIKREHKVSFISLCRALVLIKSSQNLNLPVPVKSQNLLNNPEVITNNKG